MILDMKLTVAALLLGLSPAIAGESLAKRIGDDPSCRQFNDGCTICVVEDGHALCSTAGIACVRTRRSCVEHTSASLPVSQSIRESNSLPSSAGGI
ncbi:hypothetical protein EN852_006590 [Mesorhizobium sp. M2E.F.Ca.ET.209.01.1.1]|nr:hypothetical protein EN852_006590 [Mesorhizobium sp. M2E.F.Ca.ET.209.01.1.1]